MKASQGLGWGEHGTVDGDDGAARRGGSRGAAGGQGDHGVALVPGWEPAVLEGGQVLARKAGGLGELLKAARALDGAGGGADLLLAGARQRAFYRQKQRAAAPPRRRLF